MAHHVTFGDFMAGNFLAGDFLGGYHKTHLHAFAIWVNAFRVKMNGLLKHGPKTKILHHEIALED